MLVEEEQHFRLPRGGAAATASGTAPLSLPPANAVEQAPSPWPDSAASPPSTPRRNDDPLRQLALEQVAAAPPRIAASRFSSVPEAVSTTTWASGAVSREAGQSSEPVDAGHHQVEQHEIGQRLGQLERLGAVSASPTSSTLREQRHEARRA